MEQLGGVQGSVGYGNTGRDREVLMRVGQYPLVGMPGLSGTLHGWVSLRAERRSQGYDFRHTQRRTTKNA